MEEYVKVGRCIVKDGITYYTSEYNDYDGFEYGYVFKDEQAFKEDPQAVCYIPENSFDGLEPVVIDGEEYYRGDELDKYTRKDLEALIEGIEDEEEGPINIEYFFSSLVWAYPETYVAELTH